MTSVSKSTVVPVERPEGDENRGAAGDRSRSIVVLPRGNRFQAGISAVALVAVLTPVSVAAEVGPPSHLRRSIEVAIGSFDDGTSVLEADEVSWSARFVQRFSNPWGLEVSASRHRLDRLGVDSEAFSLEVSARRSLLRNEHVDLFVYGGAGFADSESRRELFFLFPDEPIVSFQSVEEDSFTLHAGIGIEIALSERLYLRPDLRERWLNDLNRTGFFDRELSLGLGWRF